MNKMFSVIKLYFTETYKKLVLILLAMTVVELVFYYGKGTDARNFSTLMQYCRVSKVFASGCILMILGNIYQKEKVSIYGYTYQRLRISERMAFLLQCLVYTVNMIIVYLYQLRLIYVLCRLYMPHGYESAVSIFAEFLSDRTLLTLVPMFTNKRWLITVWMLILEGVGSASRSVRQRYGKWDFSTPALLPFILNLDNIQPSDYVWTAFINVSLICVSFLTAWELAHNGKQR